jgi:hypothetical protein
VTNFWLLRLDQSSDRPPGEIMAIDPTGQDNEAGLEELGDIVTLTYIEEESVG